MIMWDWILLGALLLVGATVGFVLGRGSQRGVSHARLHKTIEVGSGAGGAGLSRDDAELERELDARDDADAREAGESATPAPVAAGVAGGSGVAAASPPRCDVPGEEGDESEEELADEEAEEDLETALAHLKQEHAAHLEQFQEQTSAAAAAADGSDRTPTGPTSPPVSPDAVRRVFIVAKSLPCHLTNLTGQPTPLATPAGSPLAGPMPDPSHLGLPSGLALGSVATADAMDGGFSLDAAAPPLSPSPNLEVPTSKNSFDQGRRPSFSGFAAATSEDGTSFPRSGIVEQGGSRWRVEWEDSRSFLSNLRCLLAPPTTTQSPVPGMPPGLSPASTVEPLDVRWVGMAGVTDPSTFRSPEERASFESTLRSNRCVPVYMPSETLSGFGSFCKSILWPLLHYMMPTTTNEHVGEQWQADWNAYLQANAQFADAIVEEMKAAAVVSPPPAVSSSSTSPSPPPPVVQPVVWIHNMQLFCLPQLIRERMPRATIGLFIHTPFPSSDVFRSLPSRRELLEAMMESDLLGFHTFDYARHFLSCIKRVLDLDFETLKGGVLGVRYNGRFVSILISHVGIQSHVFQEAANSEVLRRRVEKLRAQHVGKKLIIGVEDVDFAKAPLLKLQAFDRFLSRHPEWVPKVVILEMFVPSRSSDAKMGALLQKDLDDYVQELRRKYGEGIIEIVPAYSKLGPDAPAGLKLLELVRLYNAADVAFVLSGFDGLNLLPFECTASQGNSVPCAMIISEFMGCSRSLNGVLRVNPWSLEMISDALNQALGMSSDERRANHERRFNYVMNHNIERWAWGFLDQLAKATKLGAELNYVQVAWSAGAGTSGPGGATSGSAGATGATGKSKHKLLGLKSDFLHLPVPTLVDTYSQADLRVVLLDYDGTLIPSADKTESAVCSLAPPAGVIRLLRFLSEQPNTVCFLMSGRTRSILSEWFGDIHNLGLAAEKGLFLRWPARLANACRFDRKPDGQDDEPIMPLSGSSDDDSSSSSSSDEDDSSTARNPSRPHHPRHARSPRASPPAYTAEWECIVPLTDISWKETALEIIRSYTEQTDGSWIEDKEYAIVWHYEQSDVEYGRMQCLLEDTLVATVSGPKPVQHIKRGEQLIGEGGRVVVADRDAQVRTLRPADDGEEVPATQQLFHITTALGDYTVTGDHRVTVVCRRLRPTLLTGDDATRVRMSWWSVDEAGNLEQHEKVVPIESADALALQREEDEVDEQTEELTAQERDQRDLYELELQLAPMEKDACVPSDCAPAAAAQQAVLDAYRAAHLERRVLRNGDVVEINAASLYAYQKALALGTAADQLAVAWTHVDRASSAPFAPLAAAADPAVSVAREAIQLMDECGQWQPLQSSQARDVSIALQVLSPPLVASSSPSFAPVSSALSALGVDAKTAGMVAVQVEPAFASSADQAVQTKELLQNYDAACQQSMLALLKMKPQSIISFGWFSQYRWLKDAASLENGDMRVVSATEQRAYGGRVQGLRVCYTIGQQMQEALVWFAPHVGLTHKIEAVTLAVAAASGVPEGSSLLATALAQVRDAMPRMSLSPVSLSSPVRTWGVSIAGRRESDRRFALQSGVLTHNSADMQKYLVKVLANPSVDVLRYDRSRVLEVKPHGVNKGLAATAILESLWIMHEKKNASGAGIGQAAVPASSASASASLTKASPSSGSVHPSRFGLQVTPPPRPSPMPPSSMEAVAASSLSPRSAVTSFHPMVLAIGDDRSDEDMFQAIQQKLYFDGRVRGRDSLPFVDTLTRAVVSASNVPTSIPPSSAIALHDTEMSPPPPISPVPAGMHLLPHARAGIAPPGSQDPYLFTVCVGMKPSSARYFVNDVEEVLRCLYALVLRDSEDHPLEPSHSNLPSPRMGLTKRAGRGSLSAKDAHNTSGAAGAAASGSASTVKTGMGARNVSFQNLLFGKSQ